MCLKMILTWCPVSDHSLKFEKKSLEGYEQYYENLR